MFFRQQVLDNPNKSLIEKIKREVILTLKKKGVDISRINLDIRNDNINVEVSIKG